MSTPTTDYSTLFRFNPIPCWVYDVNTFQLLDVNDAALRDYGYTREEFLSMTILELRPKEEIPKVLAAHEKIDTITGNIDFGVFTHQKKNGEKVRIDVHGYKLNFKGHEAVMVSCIDVTEKEIQLYELQQSEKKLRAASAIANIGYWRLELDGNTLTWSDEIYTIWERDRISFPVSFDNFYHSIHADDREDFDLKQQRAFAGREPLDFIHRIYLPDGKFKWVHERGRLVHDEAGKPIAFEGTVQDITAQKLEEQRLKLLESVVTNTKDAVLITEAEPFDEPGPKIIYVNAAFTKLTGYTLEEVVGKTPRILQGPRSDKAALKEFGQMLRQWKSYETTLINYKKNGEEFWNNITISPVANEHGWYTHWIAIERDVTQQKQKEQERELLARISNVMSREHLFTQALKRTCEEVVDFGSFSFAEIWLPTPNQQKLKLMAYHCHTKFGNNFHKATASQNEVAFDQGIQGVVWSSQKPLVWHAGIDSIRMIRHSAAQQFGIQSAIGIPLLHHAKNIGVLLIGSDQPTHAIEHYASILDTLEQYIGTELNRKNLEIELQRLFESLPDLICLADFNGRFLKINEAGCRLLGYEEHELLGEVFDRFVHPEDVNNSRQAVQDLREGETIFKFENRYITKAGKIIWLSWTCNSQADQGIIFASAKDITAEKKLTELIKDATTLARIGSWEIDLIHSTIFWSDIVYAMHETDPEHFTPSFTEGINWYRPDFRQLVQVSIESTIQTGKACDFEAVILTAKGNERWVRVIGQPEVLNNQVVRIIGSFQDIHEKKTLELRLREILGSISDAFYAVDNAWNFIFFNKESENLLKRKNEEVIGKNIWEIFPSARGTVLEQNYIEIKASGQPKSFEYFFPGDNCWYEVNAYPSQNGVSVYFKNIDDRKRSAEELRKAYEEKNKIIESIADAFFTTDSNFVVTYWNRSAEELLGVKREQLIGKPLWDVFPDAVNLPSYSNYLKVLETKQPITFQDYYGIWLEVNAYPSEDGITVFFRDITLRKEADARLLKAYEERNEILESIGDAFFAVDNDWIVTYWNRVAEKVLLKTKDEIIGKHLWTEYTDVVDSDFYRMYNLAKTTGEKVTFEEHYPSLNKWFEVTAYPSEKGLSVYFKDVTLRKETDILIMQANERFEKVAEATSDAIWDWDIVNEKFYRGNGFERIFGYDPKRLLQGDEFWKDTFHPEDLPALQQSLMAAVHDPATHRWEMEYRVIHQSGSIKTVVDKGVIIRDPFGKATRMVGALTDITFRKEYERELEKLNEELLKNVQDLKRANEELERFAFVTSHDLQEPLRMVSSFMDQLKRKYGDQLDEKAHQYIYFASDGAKRMKRIILDLLEYSRAGRPQDAPQPIDLREVLLDYQTLRMKTIEAKQVTFETSDLPVVIANKVPLLQTLHNLFDNAIKYSKPDVPPHLEFNVKDAGNEWIFSVKDNGIGIDNRFFEKIFIIFQRLHNRDEYEGTGIGLSIVKKHVESWGGKIWLESQLGKGTTFYFTLKK